MVTVGLTGGIATGKSTVAALLRSELHVPVIDADQVSRDVTRTGSPGLAWIIEAFGDGVVAPDGSLDRKALGRLIAERPDQRRMLERHTHPLIREEIEARLTALEASGAAVAVVEAALMVETGSYRLYDHLLVVTCDPTLQRERLMARRGISAEQAQKWMDMQLPLAEKEAVASRVIRNDSSLAELRERVLETWESLQF